MSTASGKHSAKQEADGRWVVLDSSGEIKAGPFATRELAGAAVARLDAEGRPRLELFAEGLAALNSALAKQQREDETPSTRPGGPRT